MKRISDKKLASLGGKLPFSTISSAPKRIRKKPRKASEFNRIYGSKERMLFVKSLPCAACGVVGYSENAHVAPPSEKGTGYKADAKWIAPLCKTRFGYTTGMLGASWLTLGCHTLFDEQRHRFDERFPSFDPAKVAADTDSRWLEAHPKSQEK